MAEAPQLQIVPAVDCHQHQAIGVPSGEGILVGPPDRRRRGKRRSLLKNKQGTNLEGVNRPLLFAARKVAHWYAPDRLPFPSAKTIARRMGVGERTVERYLTSLRKKGFLVKYRHPKGARRRKGHDLSPLIERLKPLAHQRLEERRQRLRATQKVSEVDVP
jgi:biotin operon repressor